MEQEPQRQQQPSLKRLLTNVAIARAKNAATTTTGNRKTLPERNQNNQPTLNQKLEQRQCIHELATSIPFLASPETAAIFLAQKRSADLSTSCGGGGEEFADDDFEGDGADEDVRRWLKMSISCP